MVRDALGVDIPSSVGSCMGDSKHGACQRAQRRKSTAPRLSATQILRRVDLATQELPPFAPKCRN